MRFSQLICFAACILLIVAIAGCMSNKSNNNSNNTSQPIGAISANTEPTQATDDATTINEANATMLPENDTTIVVNASIENNSSV